jgi:hypothetical protein
MKSSLLWFMITLLAIVALTGIGPAEKSLGTNVRVVYLHGAWVWAALISIFAAALAGLVGLLSRRQGLHYWSRALGRTGLIFWITYLPLSLWAMQTNWNGLFLAEPRWRVAMIFAIGGFLLQIGITLLDKPIWASALNLVYALILVYVLQTTEQVMHPGSPIFGSGSWRIQVYFAGLVVLTLLAAWQLARLLLKADAPAEVQSMTVEG